MKENRRLQRAIQRTFATRTSDIVTIDFETHGIEPRPHYPPKPVGLAYKINNTIADYFAWAHPVDNNCSLGGVRGLLRALSFSRCFVLCHNTKFDYAVMAEHFSLPVPTSTRILDTMIEAFLVDPDNEKLSLKPLAEKYLDEPSWEQDELRDWIVQNVPEARRAPKQWGKWISKGPVKLVGRYAIGDVDRTYALHKKLSADINTRGMSMTAYARELKCVPMLLDIEARGIPIDREQLEVDVSLAKARSMRNDRWLAERLDLKLSELGSREKLADALEDVGALDEWIETDSGARSTSIANLREVMIDQQILGALEYRALVNHQINTYAEPWLRMSKMSGSIYPEWNQVRQISERQVGRAIGTRTGRLATSPNVQNIPDAVRPVTASQRVKARNPNVILTPQRGLKLLDMRSYVRAPKGEVFINFDYQQQELRILAHYAGGRLLQNYLNDPNFDQHSDAQRAINSMLGTQFERKQIKRVGFGLIYAMGLDLLAENIGSDRDTAAQVRRAYLDVYPEIRALDNECKSSGKIVTWGGREYFAEPPKHGRTFEYKLLNRLIQGSAADVLKTAMLNYYRARSRKGRVVLTVHDEIMVSVPSKYMNSEYELLKYSMENVDFRLPMPVDGHMGETWRSCK